MLTMSLRFAKISSLVLLASCLSSFAAFADAPSQRRNGNLLDCGSGATDFRHAPLPFEMLCKTIPPVVGDPIVADGTHSFLECKENRDGEGLWVLRAYSGGFMGGTWAEIHAEPTSPLEPVYVATLSCRTHD
jgi:hypothetical protein